MEHISCYSSLPSDQGYYCCSAYSDYPHYYFKHSLQTSTSESKATFLYCIIDEAKGFLSQFCYAFNQLVQWVENLSRACCYATTAADVMISLKCSHPRNIEGEVSLGIEVSQLRFAFIREAPDLHPSPTNTSNHTIVEVAVLNSITRIEVNCHSQYFEYCSLSSYDVVTGYYDSLLNCIESHPREQSLAFTIGKD